MNKNYLAAITWLSKWRCNNKSWRTS